MKKKLTTTVMENGKSILGVIAGLAIAGVSLAAAKLNSNGEIDVCDEDAEELDNDVAEETDKPAEEESSEE